MSDWCTLIAHALHHTATPPPLLPAVLLQHPPAAPPQKRAQESARPSDNSSSRWQSAKKPVPLGRCWHWCLQQEETLERLFCNISGTSWPSIVVSSIVRHNEQAPGFPARPGPSREKVAERAGLGRPGGTPPGGRPARLHPVPALPGSAHAAGRRLPLLQLHRCRWVAPGAAMRHYFGKPLAAAPSTFLTMHAAAPPARVVRTGGLRRHEALQADSTTPPLGQLVHDPTAFNCADCDGDGSYTVARVRRDSLGPRCLPVVPAGALPAQHLGVPTLPTPLSPCRPRVAIGTGLRSASPTPACCSPTKKSSVPARWHLVAQRPPAPAATTTATLSGNTAYSAPATRCLTR